MNTSGNERRFKDSVALGPLTVGAGRPAIIVAEIGINHEGAAELCADMIDAASEAGADAIKLQTVDADANYVPGTESHELFSRASLTRDETASLFDRARARGMLPFTTCGDPATLRWVDELAPVAHKISSSLMTNHGLIRIAAQTGRPLVISTGMAYESEIAATLDVAEAAGATEIVLLQCTSLYPCPEEFLNLAAISGLARRFPVPVGFSDHSTAVDMPSFAVAAGAALIEKHFTLDAARPGFDHALSLEPEGFQHMVSQMRRVEAAMGMDEKRPVGGEMAARSRNRRCIVGAHPIAAGEMFTIDNLTVKRPIPGADVIDAAFLDRVVGKVAIRPVARDEPVAPGCVRDFKAADI